MLRRMVRRLRERDQIALVGDRLARQDEHVELERLETGFADLDVMRPFLEPEPLEDPVVVVDQSNVVAVDEHFAKSWLDPQA